MDHTGCLLAATKGFLRGSMNDKIIIQYDAAVAKTHNDPIYTEKVYTLFDEDDKRFQRKGNYSIVDNGYNKVRLLCTPRLRIDLSRTTDRVLASEFSPKAGTLCSYALYFEE